MNEKISIISKQEKRCKKKSVVCVLEEYLAIYNDSHRHLIGRLFLLKQNYSPEYNHDLLLFA